MLGMSWLLRLSIGVSIFLNLALKIFLSRAVQDYLPIFQLHKLKVYKLLLSYTIELIYVEPVSILRGTYGVRPVK